MISTNLESAHAHHWTEREQFPDEPQPVRVTAWQDDPGNGATVTQFGRMWAVQWRDSKGKLDMQGHDHHWDAITNALRITDGRKGRRMAAWTEKRTADDEKDQDQDPTGKRVA